MELPIRPITADEIPAMQQAMGYGFGFDPLPEQNANLAEIVELDRTRCAFDGPTMVGTSGAFSLDLAVPGGSLPTGGTTFVSVRATHRRRGLLRAMLSAHLQDVRERGEPLAALWASESSIYGRFGYGSAAYLCSMEIERAHGAFSRPVDARGQLRLLGTDDARKLLPQVYEQVWRERPGHFARSPGWWEHRRTRDPSWDRQGASAYRYVLYEEDGAPRGYLQYRIKNQWHDSGLPRNALWVIELQGVDAAARSALWRYALDVDLVERVYAWNQPVDESLPWLLADPRRLTRATRDSLWVRVADVREALAGRAYATAGRLVLEVRDELCPWNQGSWELEGGPDGAKCGGCSEAGGVRIDAADLGALYLGGNRFQALARAGRVAGSPEALRRADAMFNWDPLPWCPEIF